MTALLATATCLTCWTANLAASSLGARTVPDTGTQPVLSLLFLLVLCLVLVEKHPTRTCKIGVGVCVGAGMANLLERLVTGEVLNFIPLPQHAWVDLADVLLLCSVVCLGCVGFGARHFLRERQV